MVTWAEVEQAVQIRWTENTHWQGSMLKSQGTLMRSEQPSKENDKATSHISIASHLRRSLGGK